MAKKNVVAEEAGRLPGTKTKEPKKTKKAEADGNGRQLTQLLDRALKGCVEDVGSAADAAVADCTALRPFALKLANVYKILCFANKER